MWGEAFFLLQGIRGRLLATLAFVCCFGLFYTWGPTDGYTEVVIPPPPTFGWPEWWCLLACCCLQCAPCLACSCHIWNTFIQLSFERCRRGLRGEQHLHFSDL